MPAPPSECFGYSCWDRRPSVGHARERSRRSPRRRRRRRDSCEGDVQSWGSFLGGEHVGGPIKTFGAKPGGRERSGAVNGKRFSDRGLIGLGRRGGEGERHFR